jgi:glutaredoxin
MNVTIYSKDDCQFCVQSIMLCKQNKITPTVLKLNKDFTREELIDLAPTAKTFPQIFVDGTLIGGMREFAIYLKQQ